VIVLSVILAFGVGSALAEDVCFQVGVGDDAPTVCVPVP
jgi:hypothetical protein